MDKQPTCMWCGGPLEGKQTRFCSNSCKISQWRRDEKLWAVHFLGGRCARCGYAKNYSAMVFHHKGGKVFKVSNGMTRSRERLMEELAKCELVCCNCHAEEHHPETKL